MGALTANYNYIHVVIIFSFSLQCMHVINMLTAMFVFLLNGKIKTQLCMWDFLVPQSIDGHTF